MKIAICSRNRYDNDWYEFAYYTNGIYCGTTLSSMNFNDALITLRQDDVEELYMFLPNGKLVLYENYSLLD